MCLVISDLKIVSVCFIVKISAFLTFQPAFLTFGRLRAARWVNTEKSNLPISVVSVEKFDNKEVANEIFQKLKGNSLKVESVEKKEVNQEPPLLYNLTELQKKANIKYGFSADKTLSIAQKIYEMKLISYPRTGSCYISNDVFDEIPELIDSLKHHPRFGDYAAAMENAVLNIRCVDSSKIEDHHGLLITGNKADNITGDEQTIYEMIAGRMLEAFSKKCLKDATTVLLSAGETIFEVKGSVIKQAGWRAVFGEMEETSEEENALPELTQGETLPINNCEMQEKQTKPKPLHTEATLLGAMESCGKEVADEAEREAMKESGIGTPATRAAIIETLFARDYIKREKKSLVPTEKGLLVYETVRDKQIADVAMTGRWENALLQIEKGQMPPETFKKAIEVYTRQITNELLNIPKKAFPTVEGREGAESVICPKCQKSHLRFFPKVIKCPDENCGFVVFRSIADKQLTDSQITEFVTKGKTGTIKGFKSKAGKSFDAALKLDENFNPSCTYPLLKSTKSRYRFFKNSFLFTTDFLRTKGAYLYPKAS
jgi:DNA topoisomerase-3